MGEALVPAEVTRVSLEAGPQGLLGMPARVPDVEGALAQVDAQSTSCSFRCNFPFERFMTYLALPYHR